MLTPGLGNWGLGPTIWGSGDTLRFGHGGANEGFRAQVMSFARRGQGAVIMTNSDTGGPLIQEILTAIFQEYGWTGQRPSEIVALTLTPEALQEYVGRYSTEQAQLTVELRSGALWATVQGQTYELVPTGKDQFIAINAGSARFERGADGKLSAIVVGASRLTRAR
jgi:hypothetical protein